MTIKIRHQQNPDGFNQLIKEQESIEVIQLQHTDIFD